MALNRLVKLPYPPGCIGREWKDVAPELQDWLRKVAAMAEEVQKQVTILADPASTIIQPLFAQYAEISLSAAQSTNLGAGSHVEFDTLRLVGGFPAGNVSLSTGVGQLDGIITLQNRRYLVWLQILGQCNEGRLTGGWYDLTATAITNETGTLPAGFRLQDPVSSDLCESQSILMMLDTRVAPVTMQLRFNISSLPVSVEQAIAYIFPIS